MGVPRYKVNSYNQVSYRKNLLHWANWFFLGNTVLFWVIGLRYLLIAAPLVLSEPTPLNLFLAWLFVGIAYLSQLALLAFLPYWVFTLPLIILYPKPRFIILSSSVIATLAGLFLIFDTVTFAEYRFHLSGVIFQMLLGGNADQIFNFSWLEYFLATVITLSLLLIEIGLGYIVWKKMAVNVRRYDIRFMVSLAILLFISYDIFFLAGTDGTQSFTQQTRAIPFYDNIAAAIIPLPNSLTKVSNLSAGNFEQPRQAYNSLQYPKKTLHFQPKTHPLNLVLIVIDSWRFDMLHNSVSPKIANFSHSAWQFQHHFSGGNATTPGIFTLFYGIPATYTESMQHYHRGPLLLEALMQQRYQLGIFLSAPLTNPPLHRSVFSALKNLRPTTPGNTVYARDQYITQEFKTFIDKRSNQQPFFAFLFYDSVHSYCDDGNPIHLFQPAATACNHLDLNYRDNIIPYVNRYKNAVYFADQQVGKVLDYLNEKKLLANTVVMITADHGQEFDDTNRGYWEHASNFYRYQTQVPLIVYWPGKAAKVFHHTTSHYDIVPTIFMDLLGYHSPSSDYSIGKSLLSPTKLPYLIISSYVDFGIITDNQVIRIFPTGNFMISDLKGNTLPGATLDKKLMRRVFEDIRRFYTL